MQKEATETHSTMQSQSRDLRYSKTQKSDLQTSQNSEENLGEELHTTRFGSDLVV